MKEFKIQNNNINGWQKVYSLINNDRKINIRNKLKLLNSNAV